MWQILYKGKVSVEKNQYIYSTVIRMLSEKDCDAITVEKMKDE